MKKLYNNSYLIISLYLLFSFLIDILTNITLNFSFSAGMILRGMLLVYIVVGLLLKYKNKTNYYIIGITGLFSLVYLLFHHNLTGLSYIFKYNFTIILFLFFYNLYTKEDKKINRNIPTLCLLFYALSIVLCWLLDIKLLYNSTHEISAIIAIVLSFIFVNLEKRINFIDILTIIFPLSFINKLKLSAKNEHIIFGYIVRLNIINNNIIIKIFEDIFGNVVYSE